MVDFIINLLLDAFGAGFRKHPPCTIAAVILTSILFAGILLLQVLISSDLVVPIIILAFVLFGLSVEVYRYFKQLRVRDFQGLQEIPLEQGTSLPQNFEQIQSQQMAGEELPDPDPPFFQSLEQIEHQPMIEEDLPEQVHSQLSPTDHLHEPVDKQDKALLYFVGIISSVMGYALAYLLFSEKLIGWLSSGADENFVRGYLGDVVFQIVCGLPVPILIGLAITALSAPFFLKYSSSNRFILLFFVGLTVSFILYFPYQFFILIVSAF